MRGVIQPEKWKRFVGRLERNGFFEGELEGSKRYREKAAMAEVIFLGICIIMMISRNPLFGSEDSLHRQAKNAYVALRRPMLEGGLCVGVPR